jgi:hypothetical protein
MIICPILYRYHTHDTRQTKTPWTGAEHDRPPPLFRLAPSKWPFYETKSLLAFTLSHHGRHCTTATPKCPITLYKYVRQRPGIGFANWSGGGGGVTMTKELLQNPRHWPRSHIRVSIFISNFIADVSISPPRDARAQMRILKPSYLNALLSKTAWTSRKRRCGELIMFTACTSILQALTMHNAGVQSLDHDNVVWCALLLCIPVVPVSNPGPETV